MLPQMRHIQRLVVDEQVEQRDKVGLDVSENGIGLVPRAENVVGCDDKRVCEYLQTGQLYRLLLL